MPTSLRRWMTLLLLALLPVQGAIAAGGAWCAMQGGSHDMAGPLVDSRAMPRAHAHDGAGAGHHQDPTTRHSATPDRTDGADDSPASSDERATCTACAPCCGSLAIAGVPTPDATSGATAGDDFLPILVVIRPARSDNLERPPRTI